MKRLLTFSYLICISFHSLKGQSIPADIAGEIAKPEYKLYSADMQEFYRTVYRKNGWLFYGNNKDQWSYVLNRMDGWGMDRSLYETAQEGISSTRTDTVRVEISVLKNLIKFYKAFRFGSRPDFGYDGVLYEPGRGNIGEELAQAINAGQLYTWIVSRECSSPEYLAVRTTLRTLLARSRDSLFRDKVRLNRAEVSAHSQLYRQQLWNYGLIDTLDYPMDSAIFLNTLSRWQQLFYFPPVKSMEAGLLREINVPVTDRIRELSRTLGFLRWLENFRKSNSEWIIVNVPSASLRYYRQDTVCLHSKVVVGKRSTRTPLLFSKVSDIVMYPYWVVPNKIAVKELLPLIQVNRSYLDANNFQVLDRRGRVIDPSAVPWNSLGPGNFPYTLRQSTGCDNSLGIVKIQFYSSYDVYLHDTPYRNFFSFYKRFYSHGCIRVEKAIELAGLLLKDRKDKMDSLVAHAVPLKQTPFPIALIEKIPVMVVYQTAWLDDRNQVRFYGDIYDKLKN